MESVKTPEHSYSLAVLITRIIVRKKALLVGASRDTIVPRRAIPLNPREKRPLEAALYRNLLAALSQ